MFWKKYRPTKKELAKWKKAQEKEIDYRVSMMLAS
jgi:hypothetical protein